jgi:predicted RNA-binding protein YlxR (DUF448 family)
MTTQAEADIWPAEVPEHGPHRRCLVTRAEIPREAGLRFVLGPERRLVFDVTATLPGRGMWLSARAEVLEQALRRGVFARAAKGQVVLPADLAAEVRAALVRRMAELLGLARRGGIAISGFEKAREWLRAGKVGLVLQAVDGSPEERARLLGGREIPAVTALDAATLGKIFGREHAVHVAIAPGRLARMIEIEAQRLQGVAAEATSGQ